MAQLNYIPDPNDLYDGDAFDAVPTGEYKVQIIDTKVAPPKSGDGMMLSITYEIVGDQEYEGKRIFDNMMLEHSNPDSRRLGRQRFNSVCFYTKVNNPKDSVQLHGKTLSLYVIVEEWNGKPKNVVKKYLPFNSNSAKEENEDSPATSGKPKFVK